MPLSNTELGEAVWELPPLILHPFNERVPPSALLENSKAALMLSGLIPSDGSDPEDLARRLLIGRYTEVRMLFFVGKDVFRWIGQCLECIERIPELDGSDIHAQSLAGLITTSPPEGVKAKLIRWGVADHSAIFSRAVGLNAMFREPPEDEMLTEGFLRGYHRYADALYRSYMQSHPHRRITSANFHFDLWASGEYARMLESGWNGAEHQDNGFGDSSGSER